MLVRGGTIRRSRCWATVRRAVDRRCRQMRALPIMASRPRCRTRIRSRSASRGRRRRLHPPTTPFRRHLTVLIVRPSDSVAPLLTMRIVLSRERTSPTELQGALRLRSGKRGRTALPGRPNNHACVTDRRELVRGYRQRQIGLLPHRLRAGSRPIAIISCLPCAASSCCRCVSRS